MLLPFSHVVMFHMKFMQNKIMYKSVLGHLSVAVAVSKVDNV